MAFKMKIISDSGVVVNGSYVKVTSVTGNKYGVHATFTAYVNEESIDSVAPLKQIQLNFDPDLNEGSENFIKQAYEYAKNLDEFKKAENV